MSRLELVRMVKDVGVTVDGKVVRIFYISNNPGEYIAINNDKDALEMAMVGSTNKMVDVYALVDDMPLEESQTQSSLPNPPTLEEGQDYISQPEVTTDRDRDLNAREGEVADDIEEESVEADETLAMLLQELKTRKVNGKVHNQGETATEGENVPSTSQPRSQRVLPQSLRENTSPLLAAILDIEDSDDSEGAVSVGSDSEMSDYMQDSDNDAADDEYVKRAMAEIGGPEVEESEDVIQKERLEARKKERKEAREKARQEARENTRQEDGEETDEVEVREEAGPSVQDVQSPKTKQNKKKSKKNGKDKQTEDQPKTYRKKKAAKKRATHKGHIVFNPALDMQNVEFEIGMQFATTEIDRTAAKRAGKKRQSQHEEQMVNKKKKKAESKAVDSNIPPLIPRPATRRNFVPASQVPTAIAQESAHPLPPVNQFRRPSTRSTIEPPNQVTSDPAPVPSRPKTRSQTPERLVSLSTVKEASKGKKQIDFTEVPASRNKFKAPALSLRNGFAPKPSKVQRTTVQTAEDGTN